MLALWLGVWLVPASATTYLAGGCTGRTHTTLKAALTAAGASGSGHTIHLCSGTHTDEELLIDQPGHEGLTLAAATGNRADVKLFPKKCKAGAVLRVANRANVTVRDLQIDGTDDDCSGIELSAADNFNATNVAVVAKLDGLLVKTGSLPTLNLSQFTATSQDESGVRVLGTGDRLNFDDLTLRGKLHGLYAEGRSQGSVLRNLTVLGEDDVGVYLKDVQHADFQSSGAFTIESQKKGAIRLIGAAGTFKVQGYTLRSGSGYGLSAEDNVWGSWQVLSTTVTYQAGRSAGGLRVRGGTSPLLQDVAVTANSGHAVYLTNAQGLRVRSTTTARNRFEVTNGIFNVLLDGDVGAFSAYDMEVLGTGSATNYSFDAAGNVYGAWEIRRSQIGPTPLNALRVNGGQNPVMEDVEVTGSNFGANLINAQNLLISASNPQGPNRFATNTQNAGLYLDGDAGAFGVSDTIFDAGTSALYGLRVKTASGAWRLERVTVTGNSTSTSAAGVLIESGGSSPVVKDSKFKTNRRGLVLLNALGTVNAQVSGNCFNTTVTPQAFNRDQGASFTVGGVGNFWGLTGGGGFSNTCADANNDGICDSAFTVPGDVAKQDTRAFKRAPTTCGAYEPPPPPPPVDHYRIQHGSGTGLTCTPSSFTVLACANADCSSLYTGGFSASLRAVGGGNSRSASVVAPNGTGTVTVGLLIPNTGTHTLSLGSPNVAPVAADQCNFGSPSCDFTVADAGFMMSFPNHRSEADSALNIQAVRKSDNAAVCVPAFANVTKSVTFSCSYNNPITGTLPVRLNGTALNSSNSATAACGSRNLNIPFNAEGYAYLPLKYADAGQITVSATYTGSGSTGDSGLVMAGSATAIAAPTQFRFTNAPTGSLVAGEAHSIRLSAVNSAGNPTPNFSKEGELPILQYVRRQPTGTNAGWGLTFGTVNFVAGVADITDLIFTEVGRADLQAYLPDRNYLNTGMDVYTILSLPDNSGAIGPFQPHHFRTTLTHACGPFTYSGQTFGYTVTAYNALGTRTQNYDGAQLTPAFAKTLTFSIAGAPGSLGSFTPATLAPSAFNLGVATGSLVYNLTYKQSGTGSMRLRVTDADARSSSAQSSLEPIANIRSGRLVVQSASAPVGQPLDLPIRLEYWVGSGWTLNPQDTCTAAALTPRTDAVAQSGRVDATGAPTSAWSSTVDSISLANAVGKLRLSGTGAGSVDIALNLGATATDRACLPAPRPDTVGVNLPWLRSRMGALNGCVNREDSDPSARATFGPVSSEQRKQIHVRQVF